MKEHSSIELSTPPRPAPLWTRRWLVAAGIYNLVWGVAAVVWPHLLFDLARAARPNYPEIWQCVGMIVGVYGIGYLLAAHDPRTHWPIVLVGLLGKILGPIGFLFAVWRGTFPPLFGLTILTNDLIWWVPFAGILFDAARYRRAIWQPTDAELERYVREVHIAASPEAVFRFHERPEALRDLIPPWEPVRVLEASGSVTPGSRVILGGKVGPFPLRWVAVHTEYDPPRAFADRQESGPFTWWYHRHEVRSDGDRGAILRDEVAYRLPLGWVGRWLGGWFVRRKLEKMFAYRHDVTRRIVEEGESQRAPSAGELPAASMARSA